MGELPRPIGRRFQLQRHVQDRGLTSLGLTNSASIGSSDRSGRYHS